MRARVCPHCAKPLREVEMQSGAVWACEAHGVQSWLFDADRSDHLRLPGMSEALRLGRGADVLRMPDDSASRGPQSPRGRGP